MQFSRPGLASRWFRLPSTILPRWRFLLPFFLLIPWLTSCATTTPHEPLTGLRQPEDLTALSLTGGSRLTIVASTSIVADVVANVGGEKVQVNTLIPRGSSPHAYQPTPADLQALYEADLILLNGFGLEIDLEDVLTPVGVDVPIISLSEGLAARTLASTDAHEGEDSHGDGLDPHVWFDPNLVLHWVQRIEQALSRLDPDHAIMYQENAGRYRTELATLNGWIEEQLAPIPLGQRKLVLDHFVLGYFAERYDFQIISAVVPAFSSAAEPAPRELAALSDHIRTEGVPAIFVGVDTNPRLAEQLADDLGIDVVLLYTGSLSPVGEPAATYLEMMHYNVLAIRSALTP